ncbi:MAG: LysM peptidoglycan-binding domain-containing protein [Actinomycetota bacterium]|nr:LysM peptidoglycan-binding domain-containing protein [Actinomycetota bacterium]
MSDQTEGYTPYEPQTSYDWDYGDEPPKGNNILWGRLVALGAVLLITFFLGRASAPDGVSQEQVEKLRADLAAAEEDVEELEAALNPPVVSPTETPGPAVTDDAADTTFEGDTYIVQPGDTLRGIAEEFCGDPTLDDVLADFNGIEDPSQLSVGTELKIPEDCGQ